MEPETTSTAPREGPPHIRTLAAAAGGAIVVAGLLVWLAVPASVPEPAPVPVPEPAAAPPALTVTEVSPAVEPPPEPMPSQQPVLSPPPRPPRRPPRALAMNKPPEPLSPVDQMEQLRDAVRSAVKKIVPRAKKCYEAGLQKNPDLARARLQYLMTVVPHDDGPSELKDTQVLGDPANNAELKSCLLEALSHAQLRLPAGSPEIQVFYPLVFQRG